MIQGRASRSDVVLLVAAVISGAAGAAFLVLTERHLGQVAFEPVAQVWTIWAITAAFLSFSVQLNTIGQGGSVAGMFRPAMLGLIAAVTLLVASIALSFRTELFGSTQFRWPLFAMALPIGTAGMGLAKGYWAARRDFVRTGVVLASENTIRVAMCVVLVAVGATADWFGLAILVGFLPAALTPWSGIRSDVVAHDDQHVATLIVGLSGLSAFTMMSGAPIVLAISDAPDEATVAVFIALTLVRIPHGVAQGLIPRLSVAATERFAAGANLVTWQRNALAGIAVVTPIAAGIGAVVLGPLAELLFGPESRLDRVDYALAAALALVNLGTIAQTIVLSARRVFGPMLVAWTVALPILLVGLLFDTSDSTSVLTLLLVVQSVALALLAFAPARATRPRTRA